MTLPAPAKDSLLSDTATSPDSPVREQDMVFPILMALSLAKKDGHGPVPSGNLFSAVEGIFELSPADLAPGRSDRPNVSRLLQTFRNARSHGLLDGLVAEKPLKNLDALKGAASAVGFEITARGERRLLDELMSDTPATSGGLEVSEGAQRQTERQVAIMLLSTLAERQPYSAGRKNKALSMAELRPLVKERLPLSSADVTQLKNRSDTKIDQLIRNVESHNTLTRSGYAKRTDAGYLITNEGRAFLLDVMLSAMPSPDFGLHLKARTPAVDPSPALDADPAATPTVPRRVARRPGR